jgi:hypothetical protein
MDIEQAIEKLSGYLDKKDFDHEEKISIAIGLLNTVWEEATEGLDDDDDIDDDIDESEPNIMPTVKKASAKVKKSGNKKTDI